jgi:formate dehydrogenase subunit beta
MGNKLVFAVKKGDQLTSVRAFLKRLLEQKRVDTLLVLLEQGTEGKATMALVSNPEMLKYANPLAPTMPRNAAQVVSEMTRIAPSKKKVGIVLRSCELRALTELVKLKQANLDNLVLIGMDCAGTYESSDYKKFVQEGKTGSYPIRKACQVCEYPAPLIAGVVIGLFGTDTSGILVEAASPGGEKLLKDMGFKAADEADVSKRQTALSELTTQRVASRDKLFEQLNNEVTGPDKILATLSSCTTCHNCRVMCPICYCRECFFDSPTFDWEADKYLGWAERRGALRMPSDTLLYHLTRLNHMAACCVGCGMCSEACPNDVPVFDIFRLVGARIQKEFNYVPGKNRDEEPPLAVFKEGELEDMGR